MILNNVLYFKTQINKVIKSYYCTIKDISSIKGFLPESHLKQFVCSCIAFHWLTITLSITDLIVILFQNYNGFKISQQIFILEKKISNLSMDTILKDLHWVKVKYRVIFKILLIVYNCIPKKCS